MRWPARKGCGFQWSRSRSNRPCVSRSCRACCLRDTWLDLLGRAPPAKGAPGCFSVPVLFEMVFLATAVGTRHRANTRPSPSRAPPTSSKSLSSGSRSWPARALARSVWGTDFLCSERLGRLLESFAWSSLPSATLRWMPSGAGAYELRFQLPSPQQRIRSSRRKKIGNGFEGGRGSDTPPLPDRRFQLETGSLRQSLAACG